MSQRLPALHLLRLFESAARQESFKKAGEELNLTPSAISHQIKALEEQLGFPLFVRSARGVKLSTGGKDYYHVVHAVFQELERGTRKVLSRHSAPRLRITTNPSFANNIILPHLGDFEAAHPGLDVEIGSSSDLVDLRSTDVDLAIRYGDGNWPGLVVQKLCDVRVAPVCSPDFAARHELQELAQYSTVPLINLTGYEGMWHRWARYYDLPKPDNRRQMTYETYDGGIQAAIRGLGLAIALLEMESPLLKQKMLITPFDVVMSIDEALYVVYQPVDSERAELLAFVEWLRGLILKEMNCIHQSP